MLIKHLISLEIVGYSDNDSNGEFDGRQIRADRF